MPERENSIGHLFSTLLHDVSLPVRQEIQLAKTEASEKVNQASRGAMSMVAGGVIAFAGFLFLLLAATYALSLALPAWAAALIVGAAVTFVGGIMLAAGRSRLKAGNLAPERTMDSLREDAAMARNHVTRG